MKAKTVVITAVLLGGAAAGIWFGLQHTIKKNQKPVGVVQVGAVNYAQYMYDSGETMYGEIVSRNVQTVELDDEYELVKVYVETGDKVKRGDPLLEYDMTLVELQKEMEELSKQLSEINLASEQKVLTKLQNGQIDDAGLYGEDGDFTGSAEVDIFGELVDDEVVDTATLSADDLFGGENVFEDGEESTEALLSQLAVSSVLTSSAGEDNPDASDEAALSALTSGNEDSGSGEDTVLTPEETAAQEETGEDDELISGEDPASGDEGEEGGDIFSDPSDDPVSEESVFFEGGEVIDPIEAETDEFSETEPSEGVIDPDVLSEYIGYVSDFLARYQFVAADFAAGGIGTVSQTDIDKGLEIFRTYLGEPRDVQMEEDLYGNQRLIILYKVPKIVEEILGSGTAQEIQKAYENLCAYKFQHELYKLDPESLNAKEVSNLPVSTLLALEEQIRNTVEAYYAVSLEKRAEYNAAGVKDVLDAYVTALDNYYRFTIEDGDEEILPETEWEEFPWGVDEGLEYEPQRGYTAAELKDAIEGQKRAIRATELEIRESELKIKQYERKLDSRIVKSTMDGVVSAAGTVDDTVAEEQFIVITGAAGLYVKSLISESKLEDVKIGDRLSGYSYEYGQTFTAEITEISVYPSDNKDDYFYFDEGSGAGSAYPFYAFIEADEASGLGEGEVEMTLQNTSASGGIYLENYFVRREPSGRSYVFKRGDDGMLTKQYVQTGSSMYGQAIEIRKGLTEDDYIAFPYGKNVVEGAETQETDDVSGGGSYYY